MTSECTRFTPSLTLKVKGTGVRGPKPTGEARTGRSIATLHSNTASGAASYQLPDIICSEEEGREEEGRGRSGWCLSDQCLFPPSPRALFGPALGVSSWVLRSLLTAPAACTHTHSLLVPRGAV